ncbi:MAG: dicarboxylate/amino acid:cation symporter, partial [Spirochaetales bacterium]|nr:dicarboxylate/amino acid:cation symporter [Spirochaetales bacterium]
MKIWIKLLVGGIVGVLLGIFLPRQESVFDLFAYLTELAINVGRYAIFPLILFGLAMG